MLLLEGLELGVQRGDLLGVSGLRGLRQVGEHAVLGAQPGLRVEGGRKVGDEAEVVALGERLVFVVVAAGAIERDAEEVGGDGFGGFLENEVVDVGRVRLVGISRVWGDSQETGGGKERAHLGVESVGSTPVHNLVAGELFEKEAVEWFVRVEGSNDVVTIAPLVSGDGDVDGIVVMVQHIHVTDGIQPPTAPSLAELR